MMHGLIHTLVLVGVAFRDSGRSVILQNIKFCEILKQFLFQTFLKYKRNYSRLACHNLKPLINM